MGLLWFAPTWLRQMSPPPLLHMTTLTTGVRVRVTLDIPPYSRQDCVSVGLCFILFIYFILLYMKPTHKTVYTMDIKRHNVSCWLIGNCGDEPLTQRRKSYNRGKGKTQYEKQTKKN